MIPVCVTLTLMKEKDIENSKGMLSMSIKAKIEGT